MTNNIKIGLGAFLIILILFFINQRLQSEHNIKPGKIFDGNIDLISKIQISEKDKVLELIKNDSTWSIVQADSLIVKENQLDRFFDKVIVVEKEIQVTNKESKWEKFGVDDSLGKHLKLFDDSEKELIHYVFGNSGQDYQHNYVRANNSSDVYITNDNVYFLLNSNVNYWGTKPKKEEQPTTDKELNTE